MRFLGPRVDNSAAGRERLPNAGAFPGSPLPGDVFYNTVDGNSYMYNGIAAAWEDLTATRDLLQAGVIANGDFQISSVAVTAGGGCSWSSAAGTAWVKTASGVIVRVNWVSALTGLGNTQLAITSGNTQGYAIEMDALGAQSVVASGAAVVGTATANGTTAIANADAAATSSGKLRLRTFAVSNIAGTYSINAATQHDRRPWARGGLLALTAPSGADYTLGSGAGWTVVDATNLQARMECSGATIEATFSCSLAAGTAGIPVSAAVAMDGSAINGSHATNGNTNRVGTVARHVFTPAAGTHLFNAQWYMGGAGTGTMHRSNLNGAIPLPTLVVRELILANTNNGLV